MMLEKEKEKEKKMVSGGGGGGGGVVWNCAAAIELKLLLITLLFLCSLVLTLLFHFIPFPLFLSSHSDFLPSLCQYSSNNNNLSSKPSSIKEGEEKAHTENQVLINGREGEGIKIIKRSFNPYGSAAYSFIHMSTYRAGLNSFAIIGLSSKPFHLYSKPHYLCQWKPNSNSSITVNASKILPDWGYGRVYTVVVLNCTFPNPVGVDGSGGGLVLHSSTINGGDVHSTMKIEVLREVPGSFNGLVFTSPPDYDYLYCGSPLYGDLSPQRVREWIAYHVKLFGEKSHFVIYDAGGVHKGVLEVLKPWIEKGFVELHEIREQERFDGYYHNQFLVVNDCLHRYKFMAKWMFFFDVDEYIYVTPKNTVASVLKSLSDYTQFTFEQLPMSNKLCLSADTGKTSRKWGFEKLVYRDVKKVVRRDRKYTVQPRNVFATGVHLSQNIAGKSLRKSEPRIKYFHYHGTIAERREPCQQLVNATKLTFEETPYVLDKTLRAVASSVKRFEHRIIGPRLQRTHQ